MTALTSKQIDKKNMRIWIGIVVLVVGTLPLTGCWDMVELQDRGFVLAAAVDPADDEGTESRQGGERLETFVQPVGAKKYRLSLQVLKLARGRQEQGSQSQEASSTYVLSNTGQSMHEMIRDMLGQSSKALWFEHIQAVIVNDKVLKQDSLYSVIDLFRRDAEMRIRMKIFVTPDEAKKILEFQPPSGEPGGIYLNNISKRHVKNAHIPAARTDMFFTTQMLDKKAVVALPKVEIAGKTVKMAGVALLKDGKLAGYLDEYATKGIKIMRGLAKSTVITFECPLHPGSLATFELFRHNTHLKPIAAGDKIYFSVDIAMRGNISEVGCGHLHDSMDTNYILKAQALIAREVRRNILYAKEACQAAGVDSLGFAGLLKAYYPETWENIKDRWDEIFPAVPLIVSVNVAIVNIGEHK